MATQLKPPTIADIQPLSTEQVISLWPLLYDYWYTNRAICSHRFMMNILRPRKDKDKRGEHIERILKLNEKLNELNNQIEDVLHPGGYTDGNETKTT